jgi:16S rRNA (adenine1518-N6/adenine1519-N6)-dimethyltransferase
VREAGVRPAKALGQHFLTDRSVVNRIVAAAELDHGSTVIEVGPGMGVLTERLAEAAGRVIAVEVDGRLARRLMEQHADVPNITVVEADILQVEPEDLLTMAGRAPDWPYVVVGNLPYNIGSAVLRRFLETEFPPERLIVMLQREVAEAICAAPGDLSLLGVAVQVYAEPKRLLTVPAKAFYPPPKVTSSVIRLEVRHEPLVPAAERERFFEVVRAGFSAPRKQLHNSLAQGLRREPAEVESAIRDAGVDAAKRPEELGIEEWRRLARVVGN